MKSRISRRNRTAAFAALLFGFVFVAYGQTAEWIVIVNGSPVPLPRPVVSNGGELFVPLLPLTRVLGFQVEPLSEINSLRLRRGTGAAIEYDGRNGEIRYGPVVAGQVRNYKQVIISGPIEELLFPVDGLITLLAVDVQVDPGASALYINSSTDPFNVPSARRVGVSNLDYSVGITMTGDREGHYTQLRSGAMAGGIPLSSNFLVTGESADFRLQQGTVIAELGRRRALTFGDQNAISGIDAFVSSFRGVGFNTAVKGLETSAYAGRTAGTVRAQFGAPGLANYDSTIAGGSVRKRIPEGDLSFATNSFTGPERKGTSAGASFAKTTERNQMKAQIAAGAFSGFSRRTTSAGETNPVIPLDPTAPAPTFERVRVQGGALGLSFFDTFKPIKPLSITAHLERYGRNFLTSREDSEFNAQSTQRLSMTLRPLSTVNLYGGVTRREYLAGDPGVMRGFNYGATGAIPPAPWLQLSYFRVVQNETSSVSGNLRLSQYSATLLNLLQYTGSVMFSELQFGGSTARTLNVMAGRDFSSYGHLTVHDQLQFHSFRRYGAEWQLPVRHGSLRLGLDRFANLQTTEVSYLPVVGLTFKLPGMQRLVATYSRERGMHMFSVAIGGPIFKREDLRRDDDGRVKVVSQSSLQGRVYQDSDEDNAFNSESDLAMPGITVWLDGKVSTVTDAAGMFRFDQIQSGTHVIRADLAEVPADMVFADSGERRVAILPFRHNVQNFAIVRTGSLSGKVTYFDYSEHPEEPLLKPLAEARVIADSEHDTYSDLGGNITIGSLRPGTYQLKIDPATSPEGYIAQVEPSEIRVRAGQTLQGVRIQLKPAPRPVIIRDLPKQQSVSAP